MSNESIGLMVGLLPLTVMQVAYAFIVYGYAKRINASRVLWIVLTLIPVIGLLAGFVMMIKAQFHSLDLINKIAKNLLVE